MAHKVGEMVRVDTLLRAGMVVTYAAKTTEAWLPEFELRRDDASDRLWRVFRPGAMMPVGWARDIGPLNDGRDAFTIEAFGGVQHFIYLAIEGEVCDVFDLFRGPSRVVELPAEAA